MAQLVCPSCTFSTAGDGEVACPSCGSTLAQSDGSQALGTSGEVEQLSADVREAFQICDFRLHADDIGWSTSSGFSSESVGWLAQAGELVPGTRLGEFEILEEVGRGGMGIVYRARQTSLNRVVAMKVLPAFSHRGDSAVRRFRTEAKAVARLNHPNVVPVYAQGEYKGHLYYAMELIEGLSLDNVIQSQPELLSSTFQREDPQAKPLASSALTSIPIDERQLGAEECAPPPATSPPPHRTLDDFRRIATLVAGVADGLAHAYEHGVIHRDIKPHNLLLGEDGRLHITDFGLAQLADEPHLTKSGEVMGTAAYLSPEQVRGDVGAIDHRTDVYSLGATLYELLTLRRPFEGKTRDQILRGICSTEPARPRRWDKRVPVDLETVCLRAMDKDPGYRYPTALAMADDLRRFAQGRPIVSRRVGHLETAFKWACGHRAAALAIVTTTVAVVLGAGLIQHSRISGRERADNLLQTAYERLAYFDYRNPDLVKDAIAQASVLPADPVQLNLTRALASLGMADETTAMEHLDSVLRLDPSNSPAMYMRAWAQRRIGDHQSLYETLEKADRMGGPSTADAWFFRGLAAHFDDPTFAVECYREANTLRSGQNEFYPQAALHLARAHNQQLYVSRILDNFEEARAALRQLIDQEQYGAYPHYLLSIAHRLAAETYEADLDVQRTDLASHHFAAALGWARAGNVKDPMDDLPPTAEAECLESVGRLEEAIEARTQAIDLAQTPRRRWQGYHYRWRLYYWTGQFDPALADLDTCAAFDPDSRFYAHVYPALVLAEAGRTEEALFRARALAEGDRAGAQAVLWSATCLRLLGQAGEANDLLSDQADRVDFSGGLVHPQSEQWIEALYAFSLGDAGFDDLVKHTEEMPSPRKLRGEAHFHAAAKALAEGRREEAFEHFTGAYRSFDGELACTFHAKAIRWRMWNDTDWPEWIATLPLGDPLE
ncbi:MAG: protein kinase [Phycisphaerales bacterium]|nr:MAG: protein kinase [Phycisphaerales bacterium]